MADSNSEIEETFQIGTVAKLTGLSVHTLRVWERRYQAVSPVRQPSGRRQYSLQDVKRLQLIRKLTELKHPVSSIAGLSLEELTRRWDMQSPMADSPAADSATPCQILIISDQLERVSGGLLARDEFAITLLSHNDILKTASAAERGGTWDLIFIDQPQLLEEEAMACRQRLAVLPAAQVIVTYLYANHSAKRLLARPGLRLVKGTLNTNLIEDELLSSDWRSDRQVAPSSFNMPAPQQAPLFSASQLISFTALESSIHCECPKHLSSLLLEVMHFEEYSKVCLSRNAADQAMHQHLYQVAGEVRQRLEAALEALLEHEQIEH